MENYRFVVTGKVQGVWYRKAICEGARRKGFSGYVKNIDNGQVEAGARLKDDDFAVFISILEQGSVNSRVDNIEQCESNDEFSGEFEIR